MPILRTTSELITKLDAGRELRFHDRDAYQHVIRSHGGSADAEAIADAFLAEPGTRGWLVPIVTKLGNPAIAQRLYDHCVAGDRLLDGMPSEVLHCLGHLGYEAAESALWHHATDRASDHDTTTHACLGLLDLPCDGLRGSIAAALSKFEGESIDFPELLPSLAVKTGNPLWSPRLLRWGHDHASTDANGGIILGIAMFGPPARQALLDVLWDPHWEAHDSATGARRWAALATQVLGFGMRELYAGVRAREKDQRHALRMLVALLELWFEPVDLRAAQPRAESARDPLEILFQWSTPNRDDSVHELAKDDRGIAARLYEIESALRVRVTHDLEVQELAGRQATSKM